MTKPSQHLWYPCTQMNDYKPLMAKSAQGSYIELDNGRFVIDGFSSWWCKSLGHGHPRLKHALVAQMDKFEHIALAGIGNGTIIALSQELAKLMPGLDKVCYASDGSSAIEIALKMSLHYRKLSGDVHKSKFISLANSYHGETIGAMSISNLSGFTKPYQQLLFDCRFINSVPYVSGIADPVWTDCSKLWPQIEITLNSLASTTTAIIVEPIIQGAGNMRIYSQDFLHRLRNWSTQNNIHLIADEIMTGFGRTGKIFACEHAAIIPDFICIGKALTAGWLPMSAVLTNDQIYQQFYTEPFLHSHTFTGNAMAAAIALETLKIMKDECICEQATKLGQSMLIHMHNIANKTRKLQNVRGVGAMVAADLITNNPQLGNIVYQHASKLGALLRPLGNTIYWLPPLNMTNTTLEQLADITEKAIMYSVN